MNPAKARKAATQVAELLQNAHWTAREVQAVLPASTVEALLEQLHAARLAIEEVRANLEPDRDAPKPAQAGLRH